MNRKAVPATAVHESLESVQQRFAEWRATPRRCRSIPEHLWQHAVEQAKVLGVTRAAKALRLNAGTLKEHMQGSTTSTDRRQAPVFVELPAPPRISGCTVELIRSEGIKMRVELSGSAHEELRLLTEAFLRTSR